MILPNPYELVKSRTIRSRYNSIRLPLNISKNRNTTIAHALSNYQNSNVHHITFSYNNIFTKIARTKKTNIPLLKIPLNYYDDLTAHFNFDNKFLSELAYYNILYNHNTQNNKLFHIYTKLITLPTTHHTYYDNM